MRSGSACERWRGLARAAEGWRELAKECGRFGCVTGRGRVSACVYRVYGRHIVGSLVMALPSGGSGGEGKD